MDYRARLQAAQLSVALSDAEMAAILWTPRITYVQWVKGKRRTPAIAALAADLILPSDDLPTRSMLNEMISEGRRPRRSLRQRLIAARARASLTIEEMASTLWVPRTSLGQWESGIHRAPGIAVLIAETFFARESKEYKDESIIKHILSLAERGMSVEEIAKLLKKDPGHIRALIRQLRGLGFRQVHAR